MIITFTKTAQLTTMICKERTTALVGIAGASGSGKTFLAKKIKANLKAIKVLHLLADHYYKDKTHLSMEERAHCNYDHPDAIDFPLLIAHLRELQKGRSIAHPVYDFSIHNRTKKTISVGPAQIILLDGILIFALPELQEILDLKVYVDTPLDLCFIRRLQRDVRERGRTVDSIVEQYLTTVRPMFLQFVHPSKAYADLVVKGEGNMIADAQKIITLINKIS